MLGLFEAPECFFLGDINIATFAANPPDQRKSVWPSERLVKAFNEPDRQGYEITVVVECERRVKTMEFGARSLLDRRSERLPGHTVFICVRCYFVVGKPV
jgi:hypothetical protein